ncbi:MAG TPA: hypothetical protein VEQ85_14210 [Lacipirellulaceae bacterium]|nr:hypothetical protein [Lacipirellulaceae bacterium]
MSPAAPQLDCPLDRGLMGLVQQRLENALYHHRGLVRKGSAFLLRAPKWWARTTARGDAYLARPPVLSNSFPKSGTHLLDQVVGGLPDRSNYGGFLASMTSSFQMRRRSERAIVRYIRATAPGENVRAHLYFRPEYIAELARLNFVHYFIYRDPRDVIVSSCHYLREINPWHRLGRHFRACRTLEEAILLSIRGLQHVDPRIPLPNVAERFAAYEGWIACPQACALRFEDLRGPRQPEVLERLVRYFAARCADPPAIDPTVDRLSASIKPEKSHTFRKGAGGGWVEAFTPACKEAFKEVAGDLLVRTGYEADNNW